VAATRDPVFVSIDGRREFRVKRTMRLAVTVVAALLVVFVVSIVGALSEGPTPPDTRDPGLLLMPAVPTTAVDAAAAPDPDRV
jgi:hypothetical protein